MPEKQPLSVLIVTGSSSTASLLSGLLPGDAYSPIISCNNAGQCRRLLCSQQFDMILVDTPLSDEFGTQLALELVENRFCSVIILVRNTSFDQVAGQVEDSGVLTVLKPTTREELYRAIKLAAATRSRLLSAERQTVSLKEKMDEIRLINRAKWVLISKMGMSEPDAHRYIEKQAMDTRAPRVAIAQSVLKKFNLS